MNQLPSITAWATSEAIKVYTEVLSKNHQGFDNEHFEERVTELAEVVLRIAQRVSGKVTTNI